MARVLGIATVPKYDSDDSGSVFDTITLMTNATPPPRTRRRIDGAAFGDSLAVDEFGIEAQSDYLFDYWYEPNDTQHASFRTIFGAKTALLWQLVYGSNDTEQFEGKIANIEPQPYGVDNLLSERITVHRTGAISFS